MIGEYLPMVTLSHQYLVTDDIPELIERGTARLPLVRFLKYVAEPATIAFATSTSEAALPRAMECMEEFGVPREIVAFVIPAGYSFNLDGSTLYLAMASIFVAQAAGIHMGWTEQLFMVFALMLTSKGIAGVPRATLVVLMATASTFHLPYEPIFMILGVDTLLLGLALPDDNAHSPNEKFDLDLFAKGQQMSARLWQELAGS